MPSLPRISVAQRACAERSRRGLNRDLEVAAQRPHLGPPRSPDQRAVAAALAERFGWHELDLEDVLSKRQRPKIDEYPDYLFVVLHFPVYDKNVQRLNAAELDVFLGPDYLVTLPNVELLPVSRLFARCRDDERLRDDLFSNGLGPPALRGPRRPLRLLLPDPRQDRPQARLDRGRACSRSAPQEVVRDISNVKQEIISYRKIIKPAASHAAAASSAMSERFLPESLELYFDDIVDASERIWDLLDNYKEVVEALEDTNESVISHRQNDVLRLLTLISVTLLPLTLIASVFGMNVAFPGEGTREAFWFILAGMVAVMATLAAYFRYKRWL